MSTVAALFVRGDSHYKTMPGVDAWDIERDARRWSGGTACVAHPPCRAWGRLRQMAKPRADERELAIWAVHQVRLWGGVLEHPSGSTLWADQGLPLAGRGVDKFGGYTLSVAQFDWGHKARKLTWLYVVGCPFDKVPTMPVREGEPTHCIARTNGTGLLPHVTHTEREATPPAFAEWLVELARTCQHFTPITHLLMAEVRAASGSAGDRYNTTHDWLLRDLSLAQGKLDRARRAILDLGGEVFDTEELEARRLRYGDTAVDAEFLALRRDYALAEVELRGCEYALTEHRKTRPLLRCVPDTALAHHNQEKT